MGLYWVDFVVEILVVELYLVDFVEILVVELCWVDFGTVLMLFHTTLYLKYTEDNMGLVAKNLSSGFPTKRISDQSPQLQRLARELKFRS